MAGYGLLALAFWFGLSDKPKISWGLAWILAVLYAITDEIHQSFVIGRHASLLDVLVFDAGGAALALLFFYFWRCRFGAARKQAKGLDI